MLGQRIVAELGRDVGWSDLESQLPQCELVTRQPSLVLPPVRLPWWQLRTSIIPCDLSSTEVILSVGALVNSRAIWHKLAEDLAQLRVATYFL
ncbi:hypothetical protein DGI_0001 [Megalodesulfovibrio gigas DSM 1382 = ATCC 19364]|uniref:Uncharacterized protein n=1 Tax=Megalodesulfovibrio gigas (strain ATCC 19364 / DSM 1382 / NCIMB 9332 / VKM B-1759) TaxID=1121448 RepID=T2G6N1_MEGG1|nr:hypothetical protein DGI_0001 [Megalodesulfovibrio gigas DSM 1382 = ATCC 19364]